MATIPKNVALGLLTAGKARAETLVFNASKGVTYMAITRFDIQRTDHYRVGVGDLRDTTVGAQECISVGLRV